MNGQILQWKGKAMTRFDALLDVDSSILLGRKAGELIDDVGDDTMDQMMTAEATSLQAYVMSRSFVLAPTTSRHQAVDLVALASCLCGSGEEVDDLVRYARDWLDGLGDLRSVARRHAALREQARLIIEQTPGLKAHFEAPSASPDMTAWDSLHDEDKLALDAAEMADIETSEWFRTSGGTIRFYVHDARTIAIKTSAYGHGTAIIGILDIGDDDGSRTATPTPELVA